MQEDACAPANQSAMLNLDCDTDSIAAKKIVAFTTQTNSIAEYQFAEAAPCIHLSHQQIKDITGE